MANILDTEAVIVQDGYTKRHKAIISKLSGIVGEEFFKTYPAVFDVTGERKISNKHYFGFSLYCEKAQNTLKVSSTVKDFPLYKSDHILFIFQDNSTVKVAFIIGSYSMGGERHNITFISDIHLHYMSSQLLKEVKVYNSKADKYLSCFLNNNVPNYQYEDETEGQQLFQLIALRIIGAKQLINSLPG